MEEVFLHLHQTHPSLGIFQAQKVTSVSLLKRLVPPEDTWTEAGTIQILFSFVHATDKTMCQELISAGVAAAIRTVPNSPQNACREMPCPKKNRPVES